MSPLITTAQMLLRRVITESCNGSCAESEEGNWCGNEDVLAGSTFSSIEPGDSSTDYHIEEEYPTHCGSRYDCTCTRFLDAELEPFFVCISDTWAFDHDIPTAFEAGLNCPPPEE